VIRRIVAARVTRDGANVLAEAPNGVRIWNAVLIRSTATSGQKGCGNGNRELLHVQIIAKGGDALLAFVRHADASDPLDACSLHRPRRLAHGGPTRAHIVNEHNGRWNC